MKIRTDFVTNSSSSSFSIIVAIETKDGRKYSVEGLNDNSSIDFYSKLKELIKNKKYSNNVEELAKFLMDSVSDDFDEFVDDESVFDFFEDDEFDVEEIMKQEAERMNKQKENFIQQVSENISSINDISKIIISREYNASGEYADLIPDNDQTLCELAKKVNNTIGNDQKEALNEMLTYIYTSNGAKRQGETFGIGYDDIRYAWTGDEEQLLTLAKRLCSSYGPEMCEGREIQELDFKDGSIKKYAEFDLC